MRLDLFLIVMLVVVFSVFILDVEFNFLFLSVDVQSTSWLFSPSSFVNLMTFGSVAFRWSSILIPLSLFDISVQYRPHTKAIRSAPENRCALLSARNPPYSWWQLQPTHWGLSAHSPGWSVGCCTHNWRGRNLTELLFSNIWLSWIILHLSRHSINSSALFTGIDGLQQRTSKERRNEWKNRMEVWQKTARSVGKVSTGKYQGSWGERMDEQRGRC